GGPARFRVNDAIGPEAERGTAGRLPCWGVQAKAMDRARSPGTGAAQPKGARCDGSPETIDAPPYGGYGGGPRPADQLRRERRWTGTVNRNRGRRRADRRRRAGRSGPIRPG